MEVQSEHGLLVVSLENCMTSDTSCGLTKSNSCIYTPAMTNDACGHETSVVQLAAPIQCIGDIRQTIPRIQPQHVTQLQPIQYSQTVSFEPNHQLHHSSLVSNHTLYQPMTVSTTPLHHYTAANHTVHNPYMNNPSLPILTPSPSLSNPAPVMDDVNSTDLADPLLIRSDSLLESTYPAEGFDYFLEIQNFLASEQYPPGVSDNYKKCLKKRAQNYLIIDGKLHHNRKHPKEVIMRKDQQEDMLSDIHIVKESGVHLGVKKMFTKLQMKYFWRGMYNDVVNFVKKCDKCSDQLIALGNNRTTFTLGEEEEEVESEDSETIEDPAPILPSSPTPLRSRSFHNQTNTPVWRKVEVQIHGPYNKTCVGNEFVLTMSDPASRWCCAAAVPATGHPTLLAEFVFHSFCNYGFARCSLVGCSSDMCDAVTEEYMTKMSRLGEVFASAGLGRLEKQRSMCSWVRPLLDRLVDAHPTKWDRYLDHFLFQYRIGELKEFAPFTAQSPFSLLFNHSPLSFTAPEEDKENIDGSNQSYQLRRRKPNSSAMQCKHCDSLFTSKISFHIHQRKHFGAVGHRKHLLRRKRIVKPKNDVNSLSVHPDLQPSTTWKESTVSAVKAFLVATKEERRRRGKYHKYPLEVQEQMAAYAVAHGNTQTVRHFSERLGTMVSESTIRNLVKLHNGFTPAMKQEIGWYAVNYGVQSAAKYFSQWLKRDVPQSLVRKFVQIFLAKQPSNVKKMRNSKTNLGTKSCASNVVSCKSKRYTMKMKEEIGEYACSHSIKETAMHFSEKLKMLVKERTVIRFNKFYTDKFQSKNNSVVTEPTNQIGGTTQVSVYNTFQQVQNTPVTLYHLNPSMHTGNSGNTVCFHSNPSPSVITSQNNSAIGYHTVQNFSSLPSVPLSTTTYPVALLRQEKAVMSNIPATQQNQQTQTCLIHQNGLIVSQNQDEPDLPHFMATAQPLQQTILTVVTEKDPTDIQNQIIDDSQDLNTSHSLSGTLDAETLQPDIDHTAVTELLTEQEKVQAPEIITIPEASKTKEISKLKNALPKKLVTKKKEKGPNKRGKYTAYSPEIRAEIGKYAAEHGSLKACQHFAKLLGHEVPESTARGLREKYLMKKEHCPVTSLGYSQRGRPLRLGKYDGIVQECLKDIVRSGEKVSSFLAITTAKEILNKYEPELLEENGGSLKLNTTWAKSFLKRIGVHNNS